MENFELSILLWLIAKKISALADNVWQTRWPIVFQICTSILMTYSVPLSFRFSTKILDFISLRNYQLEHIYNNFSEN